MTDAAIPTTPPPAPTLGEAFKYWLKLGFHQLRRPRRADRDDAPGAGRAPPLDLRAPLPARAQLLHAAAGAGGDPTRHLYQLADARRQGRDHGRGVVLPARLRAAVGIGRRLSELGDVPAVQGIFYVIKPAVVAVVLFAAWRIGSKSIKNEVLLGIAALAFIGIFFFDIDFPWIVLAAAILGAVGGKLMPAKFKSRRWTWRLEQSLRPGAHRRRYAAAGACQIHLAKLAVTTLVFADWRRHAAGLARIDRPLQHGRVLPQGGLPHHRRRLRRAALCLSGRGGSLQPGSPARK
jgi:chromate transporter